MKRLLYSAIFILMTNCVSAQIRITLSLLPTPPSTLSEWPARKEVLTLVVTAGGTGGTAEVKIKTEIRATDGTVVGTTDLARAQTFTITTGNIIWTASEVLPLENMIFTGKYRTALNKSGKLPADNYTLCVQLVRPADFTPVTEQSCRSFYLANTQLPILMKPYNEEVLDGKAAQTAITFRWTPVVPQPKELVTYRIQVFEVLDYQSPLQALRSNQPLLDKEVKGMTQYIWQPQLSFIDVPKDDEEDAPTTRAQNNNTVKSNRGTEIKERNNQDTVPAPTTRAQNNNTVKSNRGTEIKERNDKDTAATPTTRAQNNNTVKSNRGTEYRSGSGNTNPAMKRFIWTVQSLDPTGNPVNQSDGNGESRSEPALFFINTDQSTPQQKQKTKERKSSGLKDTLKTNV